MSAEITLPQWAINVAAGVAALLLTLLGVLSRTVFAGVKEEMRTVGEKVDGIGQRNDASNSAQLDRLEKIAEQMHASSSENRTARAITELRLGHLETGLAEYRRRQDDLSRWAAKGPDRGPFGTFDRDKEDGK